MRKHFSTIVLVGLLVIGLSLLLYPTVSDYWNSLHQSEAVASYVEKTTNLKEETYQKLLKDAKQYNEKLANEKKVDFNLTQAQTSEYNQLLDVTSTGVMGYVDIPKVHSTMPIYHGTDDAVLQVAIGHIAGTSLPVGGKSTHSVISGHRGLPSAKLFTDIDRLDVGDTFMLHVLNKTLTYEVDQILVVEPDDVSALGIREGEDYCTLVTCTPYGVNSHRLLVRGHRVANASNHKVAVTAEATQVTPILVAPFVAVCLFTLLFIGLKVYKKIRFK